MTGSWSNFRPYTEDHLPVLGATPVRGLVLATGHFRNGILLAPITAEAIAELVATGRSAIDLAPFSLSRFELAGPSPYPLPATPASAVVPLPPRDGSKPPVLPSRRRRRRW